jgi:CDGSH-type Zn-finger protein
MAAANVKCSNNGPLLMQGDFELLDGAGKVFGLGGRAQIALCRCGASKNKPFCDGAHKQVGFSSTVESRDLPPTGK